MYRKLINKLAKTSFLFAVVSDIIIILASFYLSFILRFAGLIPVSYLECFSLSIPFFISVKVIFYFLSGLYGFVWEYTGLPEIIKIAKANLLSLLFLAFGYLIFGELGRFYYIPRSVLFIDFLISFVFISWFRLAKRIYFSSRRNDLEADERVLIVGAGDAGMQLARNIGELKTSKYMIIGFVDDDIVKRGSTILGIKVLGIISEIPRIVKRFGIDTIFIAIPSASFGLISKVVDIVKSAGIIRIRILPSISEIINGKIGLNDVRDISVSQLLGRQQTSIDFVSVKQYILNKRVLITGAAGSIGSEIAFQVARCLPDSLILLDFNETGIFNLINELEQKFVNLKFRGIVADIKDKLTVDKVFRDFKPQIVFHAAAYKHVPLMESYPAEAVRNNIFGTFAVADSASRHNIEKFIFISTDKAISPSSIMGSTKRIAEMVIFDFYKRFNKSFMAVRFGNVIESRGNFYEVFTKQIREKRAVTITDPDMKRYLMTVSEAAQLVLQAASMGGEGFLYVMDMGQEVNIVDFAKELIRLFGYRPNIDIPIVFTGKRPGEKISEKPLSLLESAMATKHKNIFVIEPDKIVSHEVINGYLEELNRLVEVQADLKEYVNFFKKAILDYSG